MRQRILNTAREAFATSPKRSFSSLVPADAVKRWQNVTKVGFDFDETLHDGKRVTNITTNIVLAQHGISASNAAHTVRENIKIAWGSKTSQHYALPTLSLPNVNPRLFEPAYRAFQHYGLEQEVSQHYALAIAEGKQLPDQLVQTGQSLSLMDIARNYINHAGCQNLATSYIGIHPDAGKGISAEDIQMLLMPAYYGFCQAGIPVEKATDLARNFTDYYKQHYTELSELLPGARQTLQLLQDAGYDVAIISNKRESELHSEVVKHGLSHYTKGTSGLAGSVPGRDVKPGREIVELALGNPSTSWLVGDRPSDIKTAHNAGCAGSTLFGEGVTAEQATSLGATMVAPNHQVLQEQLGALVQSHLKRSSQAMGR